MIWGRRGPSLAAGRLENGAVIKVGEVPVRLRIAANARRISLRLDPARGEFVAVAPSLRRLGEAAAFAGSRQAWMEEILRAAPPAAPLRPGVVISLEGRPCRLERAAMRMKPVLHPARGEEPMRLVLSGEGEAYGRAALRALKALAAERAEDLTRAYVDKLKLPAPEVSVTDARMRWGSCRGPVGTKPASIRYSWRLVLAPPEVFDYVAAHEVAHLIEASHSKAFWTIVEKLYGDLREPRRWLKENGRGLHAYTP